MLRVASALLLPLFLALSSGARAVDLRIVAAEGDLAPGLSFSTLSSLDTPSVGGSRIVFRGTIFSRSGEILDAVWAEQNGALEPVVYEFDPVPGFGAGVEFAGIHSPVVGRGGQVFVYGDLAGSGIVAGNDRALFSDRGGALALVLAKGGLAPETAAGTRFKRFADVVVDPTGRFAIHVLLEAGDVVDETDNAIYSDGDGVFGLVLREGDPMPGGGASDVYQALFANKLRMAAPDNASLLVDVGAESPGTRAFWQRRAGASELAVLAGDEAPGLEPATFEFLGGEAAVGGSGSLAFWATLSGVSPGTEESIWMATPNALRLVARMGDPAPGAGGATFAEFDHEPTVDGSGRVAFEATLAGVGVSSQNSRGLWVVRGGTPELVFRTGDPAPGAGSSEFKSVWGSVVNARGDVAFWASLRGPDVVTNENDHGIWREVDGELELIALRGQLIGVEGGPARAMTTLWFSGFQGNQGNSGFGDDGTVAFLAELGGDTEAIVATPEPAGQALAAAALLAVAAIRRAARPDRSRRLAWEPSSGGSTAEVKLVPGLSAGG